MRHFTFELHRLREGLRPFHLHWFPRLRSTNDHAARLRRQKKLFAPALVLTGCQTAGRGRAGNHWWSGAGALTVTFALPVDEHLAPHQIPLVAGLAVRNACAELCQSPDVLLKWPNDVLFAERKLAGLLCERIDRVDLVGLGLNVNLLPQEAPGDLCQRIASLRSITGQYFDPNDVLIQMARRLLELLNRRREQPFATLLKEYDRHHALPGRTVSVQEGSEPPLQGRCEGLDAMGRLLVRDSKTLHRIIAGHVAY